MNPVEMNPLDQQLKKWCDKFILAEDNKSKTFEIDSYDNRPGKLLYQDIAGCRAGLSICDVYLLENGQFQVYNLRTSSGMFRGCPVGSILDVDIVNTYRGLVDILSLCSVTHPNACMLLKHELSEKCGFELGSESRIYFTELMSDDDEKVAKDREIVKSFYNEEVEEVDVIKSVSKDVLNQVIEIINNYDC